MSNALINPSLLSWARQRAGLSEMDVAKSIPVRPEKVYEWEAGQSLPTFKQAQKWAALAHIPFGFLFLKEPPAEQVPLPDLRTVGNAAFERPSPELLDIVKDVLRKQEWYLDYLKENNAEPLQFIGKYGLNSSVKEVAIDIRATLKIQDLAPRLNYDEYLRSLIEAAESVGILVMRSGIVGSNTRRKLEVSEFRGFAISDKFAPVIFINISDAPTARLFTLVHELAHLWIGSTGISNVDVNNHRKEEIFCNAVAGEFLVPEKPFRALWNEEAAWDDNLPPLTDHFRVSRLVIARRAYDLGFISKKDYSDFYLAELKAFQNSDGGGGNFYRNATSKNSKIFSRAILSETLSGRVLLRDAAKLLGMQPSHIRTFASTFKE